MQPRYPRLIDTQWRDNSTLRIAGGEPLKRFCLLVRGKGRTPAELHAAGLSLDPAGGGAFHDPMALIARGHTQYGNDDLGKLRGGVYHRLCDRTEASAGLFDRVEDV